MTGPAIFLMGLFIIVIWGGLVSAVMLLRNTDDATTGELGNAPGSDDETLSHRRITT